MKKAKPYFALDLTKSNCLPKGWRSTIKNCVTDYGIDTLLTGTGSTSRERRPSKMRVRVADGIAVRQHVSWLWELYNGPLLDFSAACFERPVYAANLLHSTININELSGKGAQYEWHVDSNPVTGLLFATDSKRGFGGSLVFRYPAGKRTIVRPRAGLFLCFDAREIEHRVSPLRRDGQRISVPMNYYLSAADQLRPADLDKQIYTAVTEE